MITSIEALYLQRIKLFSEHLKKISHNIRIISYGRLTAALGIIFTFYFALTSSMSWFYVCAFLLLIFIVLVLVHAHFFRKRTILEHYVEINQNEIRYLEHDFSAFDEGKDFTDSNHPYSYDLDIFGEGSIYQSLSRTVTDHGRKSLAKALSVPVLSLEGITSKQIAIQELKSKIEFRQKFQAVGMLLKEYSSDKKELDNWLRENFFFFYRKYLYYAIFILPAISLIFLFISILQQEVHIVLTLSVITNWIIYGLNAKKINKVHAWIGKKKNILQNYAELFQTLEEESFQTDALSQLKETSRHASLQFKKLSEYVGWLDQRLNILLNPVLNSFFLYDLHWCYQIEKWRDHHGKNVIPWLEKLGRVDVLNSLGNFAYNNPDFSFPDLSSSKLSIVAQGICHPLIKRDKRIPNDFELGNQEYIAVVTGANMAGKSTFLRTVGINMVLAYAGAPVCCTSLKASLFELASCMRISDSLKDDVSYFYAELQRLKSIRQQVTSDQPMLILLDEMLKGTNSKDKQQGSKAFVERLIGVKCLALVATHDLLLGQLEQEYPQKVKNFCFESFIHNNQLAFDYKIRNGMAQNTNASFLMKKLGII